MTEDMDMAEFPALPLWTDAYMADCQHLTWAEHGLYLNLLFVMWRTDQQRVPNDDKWLARKFRMCEDDVKNLLRPLIKEFCQSDGNWITQKRLTKEWEYVKNSSERQSVRAKSRWNKETDTPSGNAETHASGNAPTPTPTPHKKRDFCFEKGKGQNGTKLGTDAWERARLALAVKGIQHIDNTPQDFERWIAGKELTVDQARKAGASI